MLYLGLNFFIKLFSSNNASVSDSTRTIEKELILETKVFVFSSLILLLKYEELISNPDKEFGKIHNYLVDLKLISKDDVKFKNAISSTKFENFKKFEASGEFSENVFEKTGEKTPFFNLGMKNDYKELLSVEIRRKIEDEFKAEMIELGYL